jgi:hypothetical protein
MSTAGRSNSLYSATTAGAKRSLGQKMPAEVFSSMINVLTWAFASCSTKATTDASVVPASRGLAHTARPFSVGAAAAAVAAPTRAARANDVRVMVLPGCIGVSFRLSGAHR